MALSNLLQSSHYLDMLNDASRNRAYRLAVDEVVKPGSLLQRPVRSGPCQRCCKEAGGILRTVFCLFSSPFCLLLCVNPPHPLRP